MNLYKQSQIYILKPVIEDKKISYDVYIKNVKYNFYIYYNILPTGVLNDNIDGIVTMLTPVAICSNLEIHSDQSIDLELYNNLMKIPEVYKKYHHQHTSLLAHIKKEDLQLKLCLDTVTRSKNDGVNITSISLGVDSLYAIDKYSQDLSHLIYIKGLDLSYTVKSIYYNLLYVNGVYKKQLILAKSNFKQTMDQLKIPGNNYTIFLSDPIFVASVYPLGVGKIIFNGFGIDKSFPCLFGQHIDLDDCLVSNEFETINVDCIRIKKIKHIVENAPELLKILRVCNQIVPSVGLKKIETTDGFYYTGIFNCSNCAKCSFTLAYLYMLNKCKNAVTFNNQTNYLIIKESPYLTFTYFKMIFDQVYQLFKNNKIHEINNYKIVFENSVCKCYLNN
uniref:Uncharacterized protein n=1 Tax=viral metagenome TaxID=1070528 RepID=A0A6C0I9L3_9ZZZZ